MTVGRTDELIPPEGVPLRFRIAGLGVRTAAQVCDIMITGVGALALFLLLLALDLVTPETAIALAAMLFFFIRIPYYAAIELMWNGQTVGKRLMKIKVVAADGQSLTAQSLVVRNLMKEAEVFLPGTLLLTLDGAHTVPAILSLLWVACVLAVPVFNRRRRRLGDLIAGTYAIHLPKPVLLKDMSQPGQHPATGQSRFTFLTHHLEHYGAFELQTLEGLLRASERPKGPAQYKRHKDTLAAIVEQVRRKIEYADRVHATEHQAFLTAFYKAQRSYLEQRQLFGDRRTDKHHATSADKS